ncbi:FAD:protein FMN transferase [Acrocarpospora catenulata]|uniref:FAD:protein FMN transferase n=1 Tax=Acrocarpospora catenulata TaxID=2836182 RepID=UPI001BDA6FB7|nr:FAD:protein FMN transferase [Acrocarpospora catenulata]
MRNDERQVHRMTRFPGAHRVEMVLSTPVGIDIRTALPQRELRPLLDDAFSWLRWVDDTFDAGREDSQINRLARDEITLAECAPEVAEVLQRRSELRAVIGREPSPARYVKGWAVERVSRALAAAGAVDHCVSAGGDIRVRGSARPGTPWKIGVRDPVRSAKERLRGLRDLHSDAIRTVLFAHDLAVATSDGQAPGQLSTGIASVTVVGPDLADASAYAEALYAMGPARARHTARIIALPKDTQATPYDVLIVTTDGQAVTTPGFLAYAPESLAG